MTITSSINNCCGDLFCKPLLRSGDEVINKSRHDLVIIDRRRSKSSFLLTKDYARAAPPAGVLAEGGTVLRPA